MGIEEGREGCGMAWHGHGLAPPKKERGGKGEYVGGFRKKMSDETRRNESASSSSFAVWKLRLSGEGRGITQANSAFIVTPSFI